jgi:hypothetical protein
VNWGIQLQQLCSRIQLLLCDLEGIQFFRQLKSRRCAELAMCLLKPSVFRCRCRNPFRQTVMKRSRVTVSDSETPSVFVLSCFTIFSVQSSVTLGGFIYHHCCYGRTHMHILHGDG